MQRILHFILKIIASGILKKYNPDIIGITGSVGKTSCKEAVFAVLSANFNVRKNIKNYNNEIGVPLTIIGSYSGDRSIYKWLKVFKKGIGLIFKTDYSYPSILILEMGADKPGDIKYLLSFIKCKIGILTAISDAHIEFFGTQNKIAAEKRLIISQLAKEGTAIINKDNELAWSQQVHTKANVMSYGIHQESSVHADDIILLSRGNELGLNFKLRHQGTVVPVFLPNIVSFQHVYAILAGVAVGVMYDMNLVAISELVQNYDGIAGRTRLLPGIKHTQLIDDTYNSSPIAVRAAIDLLLTLPLSEGARRFVVLGDMLELGQKTELEHNSVGKYIAEKNIDILITVGEIARDFARGAKEAGMLDEHVFTFTSHDEAGHFIQNRIKEGDVILIKGSQGARMERITKEIMAEPQKAQELLVRQEDNWINR
ncbi:UDP-N-acetylmuramoyl-tripeptide--D-alanyl-D-alanine ligase [Patescibacteria group bacterium]|nr:UDP-N-acetylmuramoyl-tripeptide--D-alanyl-D-alanine ligase [Patescibacteria group bacterium]